MNYNEQNERAIANPLPGHMWHERFHVILLVICVVNDFILVSKAYTKNDERWINNNVESFEFLTKEEYNKELSFCDIYSSNEKWVKYVSDINIPENPLDNEIIAKKYKDKEYSIKYKDSVDYKHLMNPLSGDVWFYQIPYYDDYKPKMIVVDLYLKSHIIVMMIDDEEDLTDISFDKDSAFNIIPLEEFKKLILVDHNDVEKGYRLPMMTPVLFKEQIKEFKKAS